MDRGEMIRIENVSKHYRKGDGVVRALDGVSLEIPKGTFAILTGPSGSGKTTLINIVAGLTRPTTGQVVVAGRQLDAMTSRQRAALRAEQIAVVFQMFHLIPYLTAIENVLLPTLAKRDGEDKAARSRAVRLLEDLDLASRLDHFPDELSVGERQRCALARALFNRPQIILADEPTGNLDPASADKVMDALAAAHAEGATVLLASHQPLEKPLAQIEFRLANGALQSQTR